MSLRRRRSATLTRTRASTAATGTRAAPAATMAIPGVARVATTPMTGPPRVSPTASAWPMVDSTVARTSGSIIGTTQAS